MMLRPEEKSRYLEYVTMPCHTCEGTGLNIKVEALKDKPCPWCEGSGEEEVTKYYHEHQNDECYHKGMFLEENALSYLLKEDVLFCNCREYVDPDWGKEKRKEGEERKLTISGETIVLFVNCNDIFIWECADAEDLKSNEIEDLYVMYKIYKFGTEKWACLKRNEKPQKTLINLMKEANEWDKIMENLPDNYCDTVYKKEFEKKLDQNKD